MSWVGAGQYINIAILLDGNDKKKNMDKKKEDIDTEEANIKTKINRTEKYMEKMTKVIIWNFVAKYVIPTIGILFFIAYFIVGYYIQISYNHNDKI